MRHNGNMVGAPDTWFRDLGQFDWVEGRMRLTTVHAHSNIEMIRRKTGFDLEDAPDLHVTPPPDAEGLAAAA